MLNNKNMKVALIVSLLLNTFMLGVSFSSLMQRTAPPSLGVGLNPVPGPGSPHHPGPARHLYKAAQTLAPETRTIVMEILDQKTPEIDHNMRQEMYGFEKLRKNLTADTVSREEQDAILSDMAEYRQKMRLSMGEMFKEIEASIPDEKERVKFFERALPPHPIHKRGPRSERP